MQQAYIYPISNRVNAGVYNPYIDNFVKYGEKNWVFLNKENPSNYGIFDTLKYVRKVDILFFNWIEKLPELKGGMAQTVFLYFLLTYARYKKIKIVWTIHNNVAHSKEGLFMKKLIFRMMMKKSNFLIIHSTQGKEVIDKYAAKAKDYLYFPHPVVDHLGEVDAPKKFDILIWGSLVPYKGIDKFLAYLHTHDLQHKYKVKIVGKCNDQHYFSKLMDYANESISIENRFLENDLLHHLMAESHFTLFTYSNSSVLSSGALAESVSHGALVVGPDVAAFKDLGEMCYIYTYENFDRLIVLADKIIAGEISISHDKFSEFVQSYHWSEFVKKLYIN